MNIFLTLPARLNQSKSTQSTSRKPETKTISPSSELSRSLISLIRRRSLLSVCRVTLSSSEMMSPGASLDPATRDTGVTAYATGWGYLYEQDRDKGRWRKYVETLRLQKDNYRGRPGAWLVPGDQRSSRNVVIGLYGTERSSPLTSSVWTLSLPSTCSATSCTRRCQSWGTSPPW